MWKGFCKLFLNQRKFKKRINISKTLFFISPPPPPKEHLPIVKPSEFLTWPLNILGINVVWKKVRNKIDAYGDKNDVQGDKNDAKTNKICWRGWQQDWLPGRQEWRRRATFLCKNSSLYKEILLRFNFVDKNDAEATRMTPGKLTKLATNLVSVPTSSQMICHVSYGVLFPT